MNDQSVRTRTSSGRISCHHHHHFPETNNKMKFRCLISHLIVLYLAIHGYYCFIPRGHHYIQHSSYSIERKNRLHDALQSQQHVGGQMQKWTHADIEWHLDPPPDTPLLKRLQMKVAANAIRTELILKGEACPPILCPKGGQAVLIGYDKAKGGKIAKFGITTTRGPINNEIISCLQSFYNVTEAQATSAGIAAIIYMFVEPQYRGLGIGELALEAISAIHTVQGCDFTVLVADDKGSGKLIQWYEKNGFRIAPSLQEVFGSSDGLGMAMIRPVNVDPDIFSRCQIKYW